jgi:hypothetical protein
MLIYNYIFFFLIIFPLSHQKYCDGMTCDDNCQNCEYKCDPSVCKIEKNCYCASKKIPGNLLLEETPQFVLVTIDDGPFLRLMNTIQNLDFIFKNERITDANGCYPRASLYTISAGYS